VMTTGSSELDARLIWGATWRFVALGSGLGAVLGILYALLIAPLIGVFAFGGDFSEQSAYYGAVGLNLGMVFGLLWGMMMGAVEGIAFGFVTSAMVAKGWKRFRWFLRTWGVVYGFTSSFLCLVTLNLLIPDVDRHSSLLWAAMLPRNREVIFDDTYVLAAWLVASFAFGFIGYRVASWLGDMYGSKDEVVIP
jgi:hypothetical protein